MGAPGEKKYFNTGVYKQIMPIEKAAYTYCFPFENGKVFHSYYYALPANSPAEFEVTVTLKTNTNMK